MKTDLTRFAVPAEQQQRNGPRPHIWPRRFKSTNVADLWDYRSEEEKRRIADMVFDHWLKAHGGYPLWPPQG